MAQLQHQRRHQPHTLLIEIGLDGSVTITVKDPKGRACQGLADDLAQALGEVEEEGRTPDYFRAGVQRRTHLQRR